MRSRFAAAAALLVWPALLGSARAAAGPEMELAAAVKAFLVQDFSADWRAIEKLPGTEWAPLPPTMLQHCLPDGGCFTRQGKAAIGGRTLALLASGARTFVIHIYFRNVTAPFGEAAVVAALRQAGLPAELARCPVTAGAGGTNWYRLRSAGANPGYLAVQTSCNGKPCEGFVLSTGEDLPPLQPAQLRLYSEQCAAGAVREPVSTTLPHEQLARTLAALLPSSSGPALYGWDALAALPSGIQWLPGGVQKGRLAGSVNFSGRRLHGAANGSATEVKTVSLEEAGMHPRGEDLLGALRGLGFTVELVRCGPVYTESTNNWYRVASARTRPAILKQSIGFEGQQAQDSYELRLDATLPPRDPRDRDPGVGGCR